MKGVTTSFPHFLTTGPSGKSQGIPVLKVHDVIRRADGSALFKTPNPAKLGWGRLVVSRTVTK